MDAIFVLRRLMELSREQHQSLRMAFVDFTKAYDSVPRGKLWELLLEYGVPPSFVYRVSALHNRTNVKVRLGGLLGEEFLTKLGLRQGCVLAPVLFNLFLDAVLRKRRIGPGVEVEVVDRPQLLTPNSFRFPPSQTIHVNDCRFADDVAICSCSPEELQTELTELHAICTGYNLKVSVKKTKILCVPSNPPDCVEKYTIGGEALDVVNKFTYLGSEISDQCDVAGEVKRRIGMSLAVFDSMKSSLWKRREISVTTKMRVFRAVVLARLLYGAELWPLTAAELYKLEAFQTFCLRRILRVSWMDHVPNEVIRKRCFQSSLESIMRQRRLRWLGHVQRMELPRMPKLILWGRLPNVNRKPGGQRKRWMDVCMEDLKRLGILHSWKSLCLSRTDWASSIVAHAFCTIREVRLQQKRSIDECSPEELPRLSRPRIATIPESPPLPSTSPPAVTLRSARPTAAERALFTCVCEGCGYRCRRKADLGRHKCDAVRRRSGTSTAC